MSDADEIVHALKEGDAFKNDASEEPTNDNEKEITNKDSPDPQHQDYSERFENLESQVQTQFLNGQNEVKAISGHHQAQASGNGQQESERNIDKAQTEANNATSDQAMDQVHIEDDTSVEDTVGNNVDEIQPQNNNGESDMAKSEIVQIQFQASDDGQGEARSEANHIQEQINRDVRDEVLSIPGDVQGRSTCCEHTKALSESSQVVDQPTFGQKDETLNELSQAEYQVAGCGQDKAYSDLEQVENELTNTKNKDLCDLDKVENHSTNGQDEAQSEKKQEQDQADKVGQGEVQCESGQGQIYNDEKDDTNSGTSQDQPVTHDIKKVKAKGAVCEMESQPTIGRAGLLAGTKSPTSTEKKRKFTIKRGSGTLTKARAINTPGQAKAENAPSKTKFQTKSIANVKLNAPVAAKVKSEPVGDKKCLSAETINSINNSQNTAAAKTSVRDKDQFPANRDVSTVSIGPPASDRTRATKEGKSVMMFWCDICKVFCTSALNLQMHFLGFKHKKIEAALKLNVNKGEKVNEDEFQAPAVTRTLEDLLGKMKLNKAVLGLDYVIEYRYDQKTNSQFVCKLCHCKTELTWFLPHLLGTNHTTRYLEKHYPGSLSNERGKLKSSEWKRFVNKKALEIEKKSGRGKVSVVFEKIGPKANEKSGVKRVADQPVVEPKCKWQKSKATSAVTENLLGSLGSKALEDRVKQLNIQEIIIGLDFLTEYHYKGKTEPVYYCELCNCELNLQCILAHIFGLKHKTNYLKRKYPDVLKTDGGKLRQIVKKIAAEMEKIDGRGTVKVIRDYDGPPLREKVAATKVLGNQLPGPEYSSFDQDQCTNVETSQSSDLRYRKPYANISSKPSSRITSSRAGSWSDPKYSQHVSSTTKCDITRKRESFKDIRHSGEDWQDEWERSIKRSKLLVDDEREREKSKYSPVESNEWQESKWGSRGDEREKSIYSPIESNEWQESKWGFRDDYIKSDKSRSYRDNDHQEHAARYWAPEKYVSLRPEDIVKKEILGFLANFKVLNDADAEYVNGIMYKLSNRLLQFGQRAMQLTGSAEKLSEQMKQPSLADQHSRYDSRGAGTLVNYSDQPVRQNAAASMSSIQSDLLTPSLLNSIHGMDVNTVTSTLTRLAANNPAFEGIRISTLVTVLMEAGILSHRPN
ncbi:uncharacterized protein LOC144606855 [Rhinoraja longicauda]